MLLFCLCLFWPGKQVKAEPPESEIAKLWAPDFYQDINLKKTETDFGFHGIADWITRVDFDGDWITHNNWENLEEKNLEELYPVIYYTVTSTKTHHFITYLIYHARDWAENCDTDLWEPSPCHENDLEGALVVVQKVESGPDKFRALFTWAHGNFHIYVQDPKITGHMLFFFENSVELREETHPKLYVEEQGHGVYALTGHFSDGNGIIYTVGEEAQVPDPKLETQNISYKLLPIETTLWAKRKDVCENDSEDCLFAGFFNFKSKQGEEKIGARFKGDNFGANKSTPPWMWQGPFGKSIQKGNFYCDPAETIITHLQLPEMEEGKFSTEYVRNVCY